ncbi:amidase [Hoyosella sp. YIM 151337]|uniref:amidase n=1 Tax=Hoyosella sp. YIM 151337 TaxID=2992742 RepID=UPI002236A1C7|nr:amidase [Hoyosella sp. YIM 151337]MCW4353197.1 amidase [Hoyosella sp. YIM 151337]
MPQRPTCGNGGATRISTFSDDALGTDDAVGIAARIAAREISASEALEAAIARAASADPALHAVQIAAFERARAHVAAGRLPTGPFQGVPTFLKDNVNMSGLPTTRGSRAFSADPVARDDRFVAQFVSLGLAVLGKTRLPEFGFNASTEFMDDDPTRNPWLPDFSAGASSGGAAALVASGAVPIAHANDGGGSIRIPAAACGLVGLKPSRGRLRSEPLHDALPVRIISDGVLTRSVRDTAAFFSAAERTFRNKNLAPIGDISGPGRRLRVGVVLDSVLGHPTDAETRAAVLSAAELLADLGHYVDEAPVPVSAGFAEDFLHYWALLSVMLTVPGRWIHGKDFSPDRLDGLTRGLVERFWRNAHLTPAVLYRLRRTGELARAKLARWDVILSPVVSHTTPPIGYLSPRQPFGELLERLTRYVAFTPLNNVAGTPALSLPLGQTAGGLPIGVHFSAHHGQERTLLELALEIEEAAPFRRITA